MVYRRPNTPELPKPFLGKGCRTLLMLLLEAIGKEYHRIKITIHNTSQASRAFPFDLSI